MRNRKGFTLVELLAAMAIIAILIGLTVFGISIAQRSSRDTARRNAADDVNLAVQAYYEQTGSLPANMPIGTATAWSTSPAQANVGAAPATQVVPLKGPAIPIAGCTTLTQVNPTGTCWSYRITTTGTTPGYIICVRLENNQAWFALGSDSSAVNSPSTNCP